jgi:hypothetical protein
MRVFHSLVLDENLEIGTAAGTSTVGTTIYTDASWNSQMGLPDKLTIFALTDTVSGTGAGTLAPALTVQIEESPDQVHFASKTTSAEINGTTLLTNANTLAVGRDAGTQPSAAFIRLRTTLSVGASTGGKAHVRLWVTGRGEQIP